MKLDFVCIGAQKAGTTTLHDILKQHPEIYLPDLKEAQFFDINEMYEKGLHYFFSTFFNTYNNERSIGNINPNLQLENRSIDRLLNCFGPDLKFIFVLRDPVDRAFSHYLMSKRRGFENLNFSEAMEKEETRLNNPKKHKFYFSQEPGHFEKNHLGYKYRSNYYRTLEYLYDKIESKNIKIIIFEDLLKDKNKVINDITDFLNMERMEIIPSETISNVASKSKSIFLRDAIYKSFALKRWVGKILPVRVKDKMKSRVDNWNRVPLLADEKELTPEMKRYIYDNFFLEDISKTEELLGVSLHHWRY